MKQWVIVLTLAAVALSGCGGGGEPAEPVQESQGDANQQQKSGNSLQATPINDYTDLEKYSGQTVYVIGIFDVHPKFRGKHGLVKLSSGLVIYIPHIDQWYKGTNWYNFVGQKVYVGGKLHAMVASPIDGMPGPYFDEPTPLTGADREGRADLPASQAPPPVAQPAKD